MPSRAIQSIGVVTNWLNESERPFGSVGMENLGAAPSVGVPSLSPLLPLYVAVDGGKQIVSAVVPVNFRGPYRSGKAIVVGDAHHGLWAVPVFQVAAGEHFHTSAHRAAGHDRVGGPVHVVDLSRAVGEDEWVAYVYVLDVQGKRRTCEA